MACFILVDYNRCAFLTAGNCMCKSQHRCRPQVHEEEKSIPLFIFLILSFKKIIFIENLLGICYLSRWTDRPKEISMHEEIDTKKRMLFSCMQISTVGLCILRCLLIGGWILLLAAMREKQDGKPSRPKDTIV